jgi:hypothetical protein
MMIATAVCKQLLILSNEHPLSGTVHSVFEHAVNLEMEGRAGLIGLIAQHKALTPYAVSVRGETPFAQTGARAGMAAAMHEGEILIPQVGIESDLNNVDIIDLSLDAIQIFGGEETADTLKKQILAALTDANAEESLAALVTGQTSNVYTRFLEPRLQALFAAVSQEDAEAAAQAAGRIAGCGMGLTPSSDDLLCGYFATLYLLKREHRETIEILLAQAALAAAQKTNRISATFLLQSGEGLVNIAMRDLFDAAFTQKNSIQIGRAIARILKIGSTSGADMLTGIVLALGQQNGGNES